MRCHHRRAAELLHALPPDGDARDGEERVYTSAAPIAWDELSRGHTEDDDDTYLFAKALFDAREFARCAHVLDAAFGAEPAGVRRPYPSKPLFLRCYALYLDDERVRELSRLEGAADLGAAAAASPASDDGTRDVALQLLAFLQDSARVEAGGAPLDACAQYLVATLLRDLGRPDEARDALLASLACCPLLWSAWTDLAAGLAEPADLDALGPRLPAHWAADAFRGHAALELHANAAALRAFAGLSRLFPRGCYVRCLAARALYNLRQFPRAAALFEAAAVDDPHRLDDVDAYSNILYVGDDRPALARLAAAATRLDRFRPETCAVVGNYYSLRGEREKAVAYFRRALRVAPGYASAWTLMGHEYVELRNTPAAVECYRHAVARNPRDYRAWYGLGTTYELLQMYMYALFYYRRAAALRPHDARMWCAVGSACEQLERTGDAVAAYTRAARLTDREGVAALRLAKLHRAAGDVDAACGWYAAFVDNAERGDAGAGGAGSGAAGATPPGDLAEALLFMARAALDEGSADAAAAFAGRVLGLPLPQEVRAARVLLDEARRAGEGAAAAAAAAGAAAAMSATAMASGGGGGGRGLFASGGGGDGAAPRAFSGAAALHLSHLVGVAASGGGGGDGDSGSGWRDAPSSAAPPPGSAASGGVFAWRGTASVLADRWRTAAAGSGGDDDGGSGGGGGGAGGGLSAGGAGGGRRSRRVDAAGGDDAMDVAASPTLHLTFASRSTRSRLSSGTAAARAGGGGAVGDDVSGGGADSSRMDVSSMR